MIEIIKKIVKPRSLDENDARREYILNILLFGSAFLLSLNFLIYLFRIIVLIISGSDIQGGSPVFVLIVLAAVWSLLLLSKKGFFRVSAVIMIAVFLAAALVSAYSWGPDLPISLILISICIVLAGMILSPRASLYILLLSVFFLALIVYLERIGIHITDKTWHSKGIGFSDIISFGIVFSILAVISWLSNKLFDNTLDRAISSEKALKRERDSLEEKVELRTSELKKAQVEKIGQVAQFTELGKMVGGIIHDILNPLTAISLNLAQAKKQNSPNDIEATKKYLSQAISASKKLEQFIVLLRRQIKNRVDKTDFCLNDEIKDVIKILTYKANATGCAIVFNSDDKAFTHNSALKFSQIILNLISNGIEACKDIENPQKEIRVKLNKINDLARISVADCGVGITKENLKRIFDPFFTLKNDEGVGIGLTLTKEIIETDFHGTIAVNSIPNFGTEFIIELPLKNLDA